MAVAVPVVVEAGPALPELAVLLGFAVAFGLVYSLDALVKGMGGFLGEIVGWVPGVGHVFESTVTAPFKWLDSELGKVANGLDYRMAVCIHRIAHVMVTAFEDTVHISKTLALLVEKTDPIYWAVKSILSSKVHAATVGDINTAWRTATHAEQVAQDALRKADLALEKARAHPTATIEKIVHGATATVPQVIVRPIPAGLEHDIASLRERTRAIEDSLENAFTQIKGLTGRVVSTVALTAVAASLLRLGLGWLKCNNVGKVGKALCGAPLHRIEELLGLLVDVFVITDICKVVELLDTAAAAILGPIGGLAGTVGAALCHGEYNAAPIMSPPALYLPPSQGGVTQLYLP